MTGENAGGQEVGDSPQCDVYGCEKTAVVEYLDLDSVEKRCGACLMYDLDMEEVPGI